MRLREKLIELIAQAVREYKCLVWELADHIIANDVVIEVHAHWEDGSAIQNGKEVYQSIDCSHCEEVFKIESETREYWKARFKVCPFCGAVMDGGNKDGTAQV